MLNKLQLQILPELQLQNLDQPLCSKSEQMFSFRTKPQVPNLQQTVASNFLSINISDLVSEFVLILIGHLAGMHQDARYFGGDRRCKRCAN